MFFYIASFIFTCLLVFLITPVVICFARDKQLLDHPTSERKIHKRPIPLLGGWSVFLAFVIGLAVVWSFEWLSDGVMKTNQIWGVVLGGVILMVGGYLDDKYNLKPWQSFLFPVVACFVAVAFGIQVDYITNPFLAGAGPFGRSLFYFDWIQVGVLGLGQIFSFLWILGMIYTTKVLDGLDGLVSGIGLIGTVILFVVSLFWNVPMSANSILALLLAGSLLGFLFYNFHPAKIFLGEAGSTFVGFMLGVLAIISGAKIATALLIVGVPIIDVAWNMIRRLATGKHIYQADKKHIHHRLLDVGLSHRQAVFCLWLISLVFGVSSIFLQTMSKVWALVVLVVVAILLLLVLVYIDYKKNKQHVQEK